MQPSTRDRVTTVSVELKKKKVLFSGFLGLTRAKLTILLKSAGKGHQEKGL